jgi:TolA-binding protein
MQRVLEERAGQAAAAERGARAYWHAVALYENGRRDEAEAEVKDFPVRHPGSAFAGRAARLEAWCHLKAGRVDQALAVFEQFDRQHGAGPEGAANLLDWGRALVTAGRFPAAHAVLERLLARTPVTDDVQQGKLWMAQALAGEGHWDKAWNLLSVLAGDGTARQDRRAQAWFGLSELEAGQTNVEAAVASATKGAALAPTQALRNRGRALTGRWLLRQGRLAEAAALLKPAIAELTEDPWSAELQLELADAYLARQVGDKAEEEYQHYLETFGDPAGQRRALRGRGLALWSLQRYAEAATVFEKAAALAEDPAEGEALLVKAADAIFANGQFRLAAEAYERVLARFPSGAAVAQATFQRAESLARQSLWAEAEAAFREVVRRFPGDPLAERALLRVAEMKEERGPAFMREALAAYADLMAVYPRGALFAEALHRHGLVAYQLGLFDAALGDFTQVVERFADSRVSPQAFFMRGWALYMRGQEAEALAVCETFVDKYPASEWTPDVIFWLGEYAYNHGLHASAERRLTQLAEAYPAAPLADKALLWAGRAAMKQKEYLRAMDLFARLAVKYPDSPSMAEARFLQGDALSELGEFSRAILVFEELIAKYPDSPLIGAAWGRKGDCQFTLGATEARRYEEAMTSYRSVARSPGVTFDLALQAAYKLGRCLDKLGRKAEAFEQYYGRVVLRYLAEPRPAREQGTAAAVWFTKAAFSAAELQELDKNWRQAVRVLERVVNAGVPASEDARKRIEQIRSEHWIW